MQSHGEMDVRREHIDRHMCRTAELKSLEWNHLMSSNSLLNGQTSTDEDAETSMRDWQHLNSSAIRAAERKHQPDLKESQGGMVSLKLPVKSG